MQVWKSNTRYVEMTCVDQIGSGDGVFTLSGASANYVFNIAGAGKKFKIQKTSGADPITLEVAGNITASGNIDIDGDISSSGDY